MDVPEFRRFWPRGPTLLSCSLAGFGLCLAMLCLTFLGLLAANSPALAGTHEHGAMQASTSDQPTAATQAGTPAPAAPTETKDAP